MKQIIIAVVLIVLLVAGCASAPPVQDSGNPGGGSPTGSATEPSDSSIPFPQDTGGDEPTELPF